MKSLKTFFMVFLILGFNLYAQTARVQIIHNSSDILAGSVDVYVNGALAIPDFAFRSATPFIDLTAGVTLNIGVAPGNSNSVNDTLKNFPVVLTAGEKYVVFANGVYLVVMRQIPIAETQTLLYL
jgi:hypothetical protein